MMKKYLIIGVIVLLGIGLFVLGYFLRKEKEPMPPSNGNQNPPPSATSTPVVTPGVNSRLKLESLGFSVKEFFADTNGDVVIVQPSGHITSIVNGKNTLLSETNIQEIFQVDFSPNGKRVLVGFGGWNKRQFSVFDIEKKSWQPLVEGVMSAAWNPIDNRAVYALKKPAYTSLSVIDFAISKPVGKEIIRIHVEDVVLSWLGKDEVVFWNKGNSRVPSSAWKVNVATKKFTPLFSDITSFEMKADDKGENILALSDRTRVLGFSLHGKQGEFLKELAIKTVVDKCDFDFEEEVIKATSTKAKDKTIQKTFLYCGAPKNFPTLTGKVLVEDYAKRQIFSLDNFFKISVPTGSFVPVYEEDEDLDASNVRVAGKKLFFINRYDEKLYSIALE